ncbi:MAG TPA: DinB family protein, partial [Bryobacteraceae bacterium]|nr:DinB family protein [Bryobacteraceae bacterium]
MISADYARTHLRYSTWASRKLLDAALKLPPEQLHADVAVAHKSIYGTLAHILFGDRIWLARVTGENIVPQDNLEIEWPQIQDRWVEFADGLSDADLVRVISYKDKK